MNIIPRWRKSSYSSNQESCVEVADSLDAVRDSKNPNGPCLRFATGLAPFLQSTKSGLLDRQ